MPAHHHKTSPAAFLRNRPASLAGRLPLAITATGRDSASSNRPSYDGKRPGRGRQPGRSAYDHPSDKRPSWGLAWRAQEDWRRRPRRAANRWRRGRPERARCHPLRAATSPVGGRLRILPSVLSMCLPICNERKYHALLFQNKSRIQLISLTYI